MKSFFRSIKYLKPYRLRLAVSIICVIGIASLWGGGLGMLLPGMKILIAPEGLHGWAWNSLSQDRLDARIVERRVSPTMQKQFHLPPTVVDIVDVSPKGQAHKAGVKANEWLIGVVQDGKLEQMPAYMLARKIALMSSGDKVTFQVFDQETENADKTVTVTLDKVENSTRLLGELANKIPEPQTREDRFPIFVWLLIVVGIMTIVRNLLRFVQEYLVQTAVMQSMMDMREECYNVALRQPVTYFAVNGTTDTMSRFVQDSTELARAQDTLFGKTLAEPAKAIASISMALFFSWELTLIAMVGGPFAYVLIRKFGKIMKRSTKRALESWSDMLAVLEETLTGIRVVKAYTMEASERKRFFRVQRNLYKQQRRIARTNAATSPTVEALGMIAGGAAAGGAGYLVFNGSMDPELFMAWMACLAAMFDPVRKLSKVVTRFQRGDAAAERLFELRDREIEKRVPGAPQLPVHSKSIEFNDVSFRYPGSKNDAVKNVTLNIKAGQTYAFVGPNGSGKTTLVSLLPRLLEATEGQIKIDGCDIATHSLRSLRRQIGIVTQETVIFNATIAENISYGLRRSNKEQVLNAARQAFVDEFVREMPEGYDTEVGQRGATLSGGQRQRISIARAILRDPAILIFDEAMSQVDPDSEQKIYQATQHFMKDRTTLMIAHRFSTILASDAIVVMDEGKIVDAGRHEELLERCELYSHLYRTQFASQENEE